MTRMLEENIDFDNAVQAVIDWVEDPSNGSNWDNTLLIVTADHECGHLQPAGDVAGDAVILNQCWALTVIHGEAIQIVWSLSTPKVLAPNGLERGSREILGIIQPSSRLCTTACKVTNCRFIAVAPALGEIHYSEERSQSGPASFLQHKGIVFCMLLRFLRDAIFNLGRTSCQGAGNKIIV